jgi:hypothetical protein
VLRHFLCVCLTSIGIGRHRHLILHLILVAKDVGDTGISVCEWDAYVACGDRDFQSHDVSFKK